MTHDELLAKIVEKEPATLTYSDGEISHSTRRLVSWQLALRAVVELHKPEWVLPQIILRGTKPEPIAICTHCSDEQWRKSYPCPTIQALEEQIK